MPIQTANPLKIKKENTADLTILCKDKNGVALTTLAILTEAIFQVRDIKTGVVVIDKRLSIPGEIGDIDVPSDGYLTIFLSPIDTNITPKRYYFGLELQWGSNDIYELNLYVDGRESDLFEITQDVVR